MHCNIFEIALSMYYPTLQNNQGMAQKVKKAQQRDPQVSVKLVKLPVVGDQTPVVWNNDVQISNFFPQKHWAMEKTMIMMMVYAQNSTKISKLLLLTNNGIIFCVSIAQFDPLKINTFREENLFHFILQCEISWREKGGGMNLREKPFACLNIQQKKHLLVSNSLVCGSELRQCHSAVWTTSV